ncbi:hypothetical protein [Methylocapsa sp. S129]|uniref:hypothetical protein n=1 Tax=Methylocapsa sp. S129 TaxID=1641869 RepID=UPI00131D0A81|nr:hypothetical protein [Methylocapsa sp. S129]
MSRLSKRTAIMAASAMQTGIDAAVTIAARTPGLLNQSFNPTAESVRETQRMFQEKVDAVYEGAAAAQFAWASFFLKASFGGIRNASDLSLGLADVAEAAIRPARRKVRANAKRLTGLPKIG